MIEYSINSNHLSIGKFKSLNINFYSLKFLLILLFTAQRHLQSVGDKHAKIDSLIDWKFFVSFLNRYFLTKLFPKADPKLT